ncbi:MAG TPA: hypothetical protein VL899_15180 [Alphaproteobacteria bacterium]|nr:hypothetical protein [Alphaproteobacteria bacterium]
MKVSHKLGLTAIVGTLSAAAMAPAADLVKGTYDSSTYVTSASGNLCGTAGLTKGTAQTSTVVFPGNGQPKMVLASPYTSSKGSVGSASTNVCVATAKVPTTGIDGKTLSFNCYADTVNGPAKSAQAVLKAKFDVGASHSTSIYQVTVHSQILVNGTNICSFTTDGTYALQ